MSRKMGSIYDDPVFVGNSEILQRESPQGLRILGGIATAATEFPDCVAVGDETDWCCTGTLVAPNVVVTAGHCAESCAARVYAGLNTNTPDPAKIFNVAHVIRHQEFDDSGSVIRNDLTVLILDRDVPGVTPRKIAASAAIDGAAWLRVVGFGRTDTMGRIGYGRQRRVDVAIASASCGDSSTASRYGCVSDLEIVAGSPNRDSCNGDSGGPAYVRSDGQWYLAGATSRAIRGSRTPCGGGGIYVRVDKYRDFIRTVALANGGHWTD
jgi:secreted trypsin-like serine protease